MISLFCYAENRYHINVLNEISSQQAQNHPRPWEISIYTYTNPIGIRTTKYFVFAQSIKHNSQIILEREKRSPYPWVVKINGYTYYADFDNSDELQVGDSGVLKYEGDRLYFYKE